MNVSPFVEDRGFGWQEANGFRQVLERGGIILLAHVSRRPISETFHICPSELHCRGAIGDRVIILFLIIVDASPAAKCQRTVGVEFEGLRAISQSLRVIGPSEVQPT